MTDTGIELTCIAEEVLGRKLPIVALEDLLNKHFQLNDYGDGVQKIFFIFIAVNPKNTIHEPHVIYTELEANLEIALKLNYQNATEANGKELMTILQKTFVEGIDLCASSSIGSFDWPTFSLNVKKVFESNS